MDAFTRTRSDAAPSARPGPDGDRPAGAFRPLALPALAAALQMSASAARAARNDQAGRRAARIVHEDEPAQ